MIDYVFMYNVFLAYMNMHEFYQDIRRSLQRMLEIYARGYMYTGPMLLTQELHKLLVRLRLKFHRNCFEAATLQCLV